ncbi:Pyridine nucleotide-disulfide oxidoreductase dimerization region [Planctomycetales bacterium 10988]|nr:Pyridine nucleotide-disulfide oxidoreductase dimerization region [Planctomycetales bacterium 10988]
MASSAADRLILPPDDRFNQRLVENVHPQDWKNPEPAKRYNLVVIGGGTAGLVTAAGAAGLGAKVALIERNLLGGDCLNVGCVPSKALIRAARTIAELRRASEFGVTIPNGWTVDFSAIMERMRALRAEISPHDSAKRFASLGVDVFLGDGIFRDGETIEVGGSPLKFSRAVIATGARAAIPNIPGLTEAGYLTNETVFQLTELPRRLAILGGGPIGCELAQAFSRFGSEVTLFEKHSQLLPKEDPDAASIIQEIFQREKIKVLFESEIEHIELQGTEKHLTYRAAGQKETCVVDAILVSAGRQPNVEDLGLEQAGVLFDPRQGITVDDQLRTSHPHIYAAGDICSKYRFTHAADAMARIVIRNALFLGREKVSSLTIPWCTYTDPEIAHVGLTERMAEEQAIAIETFKQPLDRVDRALLDGETSGLAKIHVKKGTDKIVGATLVSAHAGESISEITLAMVAGKGLKTLASVIHPYPTQAEMLKKTADAYQRTRLTPFVKGLFEKWLAWRR